ncbi:chloride channel protein [Chroococcidiopsis cubana SAG 39.79]|uniref:Chloride channel protein n=1 Tax=Chroococcidiopsis cubana SAG 39.79 TaxID=388085 RepID=A0AB37UHR1_9CYAN|nr:MULTISPECIES: chloride channel protein [Chroococcidiopsis]PSB65993.1 chloride channel protein [Chroococcidiopsis cubana CCALA 043]RUT10918.1 chloride channel protein [Chroococcidiopsis cubana SAG 39.79]URD49871.1 chloride channel protein [Chroococcidiopsis sp. CCNUC1]
MTDRSLSEVSQPQSGGLAAPSNPIAHILNRFQPSPEAVVLLLAVLIGGGTGMGVVTFHYLIELVHYVAFVNLMGTLSAWGAWTIALVPTLGGFIVGLMLTRRQDFGPGLSSLIAAASGSATRHAILQRLQPVTKMVAASVSLGSGASLGPEGPSVEVGANFGVLLAHVLQVSQERQRLLLGAGAAAGLAAGFNAPIAGVFFALEVVLGTTFANSAVSVVLLAAVVSALVAQIGLGGQPAFALPVYEVRSPLELPLYVGLGIAASIISIAYTQLLLWGRACFRGQVKGFAWLGRVPLPMHPVIGGACVGLVALLYPQILGIGYETIEAMLQDVEFSLLLLLILLVLKLVTTAISMGSGLVGGVFAPAMFLGASLGAAYGKILAALLPQIGMYMAGPPAYAMVGMAAVLAGSAKAPLTAILLLFELTRDYRIVLPLMAAVGLSVWLVERLKKSVTPESSANLQQLNLNLVGDEDREIVQQILVREAIYESPLMLPDSMSVSQAGLSMTNAHCRSALVVNPELQLLGIVTLEDINRAIATWENADAQLVDICTTDLLYAYTDEPLSEALSRMGARGLHQLPIVDRDQPEQVLGLLEREQIALTCKLATTRKALHPYLKVSLPVEELALPKSE